MATTTKNLGIVSPVPADEWNASTTYQKLNIVSHNNGSYIAKQGSTGIEPGVTTNWQTYWMLLVSSTGGGGSDVEVVQTTGQSTTAVMSQKAVTDELNSGANVYKHTLSIPCVMNGDKTEIYTLKVNIISSSSIVYTFNSFCASLIDGPDKTLLPCFALTPSNGSFTTGAIMVYNLIADYTEEIYSLTVKALLFEDFDGAMQPERELNGAESIDDYNVFSDTVTQL